MTVSWFEKLSEHAKAIKNEIHALALAFRDPRTPLLAKVCVVLVVGYALSPIDLIPDFLPVIGSLDDLLLLPLGIALAIRLVPEEVMREARLKATQSTGKELGKVGGVVIGLIWLALLAAGVWWVAGLYTRSH